MNTRISDAAVETAIDAYENAPGVMQFPAMKAALEAYEAHKAEQQGADAGRAALEFIAAANFDVPDGYVVEEHLPGIWHYTYSNAGERMASCTSWNNKAHATIAAWQAALATVQPKQFHHVKQVAEHFNMAVTPKEMAEAIAGMPSELCSKESAHAAFGHLAHVQPSPAGQGDARVQFEAWNVRNYPNLDLTRGPYGDYISARVRSDWELWQAARPLVGVPAGWKMVPQLASEEQLRAALDTGAYHDGEDAARAVLADEYRVMVEAAPPAQAVDLGQLRRLADGWLRIANDKDVAHKDRAMLDMYDKALRKCAKELVRELAPIDGETGVGRG